MAGWRDPKLLQIFFEDDRPRFREAWAKFYAEHSLEVQAMLDSACERSRTPLGWVDSGSDSTLPEEEEIPQMQFQLRLDQAERNLQEIQEKLLRVLREAAAVANSGPHSRGEMLEDAAAVIEVATHRFAQVLRLLDQEIGIPEIATPFLEDEVAPMVEALRRESQFCLEGD